jgi:hypothetical protein
MDAFQAPLESGRGDGSRPGTDRGGKGAAARVDDERDCPGDVLSEPSLKSEKRFRAKGIAAHAKKVNGASIDFDPMRIDALR